MLYVKRIIIDELLYDYQNIDKAASVTMQSVIYVGFIV
jgi:hypothetical protein